MQNNFNTKKALKETQKCTGIPLSNNITDKIGPNVFLRNIEIVDRANIFRGFYLRHLGVHV